MGTQSPSSSVETEEGIQMRARGPWRWRAPLCRDGEKARHLNERPRVSSRMITTSGHARQNCTRPPSRSRVLVAFSGKGSSWESGKFGHEKHDEENVAVHAPQSPPRWASSPQFSAAFCLLGFLPHVDKRFSEWTAQQRPRDRVENTKDGG
jgi:hypothetical protein